MFWFNDSYILCEMDDFVVGVLGKEVMMMIYLPNNYFGKNTILGSENKFWEYIVIFTLIKSLIKSVPPTCYEDTC